MTAALLPAAASDQHTAADAPHSQQAGEPGLEQQQAQRRVPAGARAQLGGSYLAAHPGVQGCDPQFKPSSAWTRDFLQQFARLRRLLHRWAVLGACVAYGLCGEVDRVLVWPRQRATDTTGPLPAMGAQAAVCRSACPCREQEMLNEHAGAGSTGAGGAVRLSLLGGPSTAGMAAEELAALQLDPPSDAMPELQQLRGLDQVLHGCCALWGKAVGQLVVLDTCLLASLCACTPPDPPLTPPKAILTTDCRFPGTPAAASEAPAPLCHSRCSG